MRCIGAGATGEVWEAEHQKLTKRVAIKFLASAAMLDGNAERLLERFRYEAQVSARLGARTTNILGVHDIGIHGGLPFIVMDIATGQTVEDLLRSGPVSSETAREILTQVGRALEAAHTAGIAHRDVKPANILVHSSGGGPIYKLADFGLAREFAAGLEGTLAPRATGAGITVGSPSYMSPEQICGERPSSGATDVWALAVVAYELLIGTLPFDAANLPLLAHAITSGKFNPLPEGHPDASGLQQVFARAFSVDRAERFASVTELLEALDRVLRAWGTTRVVVEAREISPLAETVEVPSVRFVEPALREAAEATRDCPAPLIADDGVAKGKGWLSALRGAVCVTAVAELAAVGAWMVVTTRRADAPHAAAPRADAHMPAASDTDIVDSSAPSSGSLAPPVQPPRPTASATWRQQLKRDPPTPRGPPRRIDPSEVH